MSQLTLTSDPLGSATTGTFEFENPAFFMTGATSQRGAVLVDQYTLQTATHTLASQTAAQALSARPRCQISSVRIAPIKSRCWKPRTPTKHLPVCGTRRQISGFGWRLGHWQSNQAILMGGLRTGLL